MIVAEDPFYGRDHKSKHHIAVERAIATVNGPPAILSSGSLIFASDDYHDRWRDAAQNAGWIEDSEGRMVAPVTGDAGHPIVLGLMVR
jgi:hypothetical protein